MSPYVRPNKDTDTRPSCVKCDRLALCRGFCRPCYLVAKELGEFVPRRRPGAPVPTCSITGCSGLQDSRGWCAKHYKRFQAHGDPHQTQTVRESSIEKQQWLMTTALSQPTGNCVDWPWSKTSGGYGQLRIGGNGWRAHVLMAFLLTGQASQNPNRIVLHACDRPSCVAPWHLSWGTQSRNVTEGWARTRGVAA